VEGLYFAGQINGTTVTKKQLPKDWWLVLMRIWKCMKRAFDFKKRWSLYWGVDWWFNY
jgi:hypothetical protein